MLQNIKIKTIIIMFAFVSLYLATAPVSQAQPKIIIDTDFCLDQDDLGAMATLHALADNGECEILAVIYDEEKANAADALDVVNTWYQRPALPIGIYPGSLSGDDAWEYEGIYTMNHDLSDNVVDDAVTVYENVLAAQPDNSVTILCVGFFVNLHALIINNPTGLALVEDKVERLIVQEPLAFGGFNSTHHNLTDLSIEVIDNWPTTVVFSDFGDDCYTGAPLEWTDQDNPVREGWRLECNFCSRPSWDQAAVLYAVRGSENFNTLSSGTKTIGGTTWSLTTNPPAKLHASCFQSNSYMANLINDLMTQAPLQGTYYTLNTSVNGSGSITLDPAGGTYEEGTTVTATANPGSGATFDNWSGDATGTNNPITITMDSDKSITANFSGGTGPDPEVTGTLIGTDGYTTGYGGGPIDDAVDGNTSTFFDAPSADGGWVGYDFGSGNEKVITRLRYYPRADFASRMNGGVFQGSDNSSFSGAVNLHTISSTPPYAYTEVDISNGTGFRYVRYLAPDGGWGNIAEVDFYGHDETTTTQYTLSTSVNGSGSITLSPAGGTYDEGTTVTVTASPASGWQFDNWSGDVTGTNNPITITMDGNKSVTANFSDTTTTQYTLSTSVNGSGSITLDPAGGTYDEGTTVSVTANPASGWQFDNWSGDATGTSNPVTITMNSDKSITANFSDVTGPDPEVTGTLIGTDGYTTGYGGGPIDDAVDGNTSTFFDAPSADGGWVGYDFGSGNEKIITRLRYYPRADFASRMNGGVFQGADNVDFTNAVNLHTISSTPPYAYTEVDISNGTGFRYVRYLAPDGGWGNIAEVDFYGHDDTTTTQYTLSTSINGSGSITLDPAGGTYDEGTTVTVTANPDSGATFDNWSGDATGTNNPITITMDSDKSITANFSDTTTTQFTLSTSVNGSGSIALDPAGGTYDEGTTVTVTANPDSGATFDNWSGDATGTNNPITITMDSDKSITANFSGGTGPDPEVTGTLIGTDGYHSGYGGGPIDDAVDGNTSTFFDAPSADGGWVGYDFGSGNEKIITRLRYYPRADFASRMNGGVFQGSNNSSFSGAANLHTISSTPPYAYTEVDISNGTGFRYVRYLAPDGGWGNIAEVDFYGHDGPAPDPEVTGALIGTSGYTSGYGGGPIDDAVDGNTSTFFDAPSADGGWVGYDFGSGNEKIITRLRYYPRADFASRMNGGVFQGADNSSFSGAVNLHTINSTPPYAYTEVDISNGTGFRYVRYLAPDGGWGNIAEVDFYGHDGLAKASENFTEKFTADTPEMFVLKQNYPNPFNPSTKISYSLPKQSYVEIKVFDVLGNEVAVLFDGNQQAGSYEIEFCGTDLASGIYLCFIRAGEFSAMNRMILIK